MPKGGYFFKERCFQFLSPKLDGCQQQSGSGEHLSVGGMTRVKAHVRVLTQQGVMCTRHPECAEGQLSPTVWILGIEFKSPGLGASGFAS